MIKRIYKTKEECVDYFVNSEFDCFPSNVLTYPYDDYYFMGNNADGEYDDLDDMPMWNVWFIPSEFVWRFIERNPEKVADCGFVIIYDNSNGAPFALGVDGCGYSFRDAHFSKLYDAMGLRWHDDD